MTSNPPTTTSDPVQTATAFVGAVVWGEHLRVWELLGREGRTTVLRVATDRGMPEDLAARLRDGTAATLEREEFLTDLVNGLRSDLHGNDVDALEFELGPDLGDETVARVVALSPTPAPALLGGALPAASIELAREDGTWRVVRLVPRLAT